MDMPMLDPALDGLAVSDPTCIRAAEACFAFYAAENASQETLPWADLFKYGHWTAYYYVSIVGLFSIAYLVLQLDECGFVSVPIPGAWTQCIMASFRYLSYRRLKPAKWRRQMDLPANLGTWSFLFITLAFLAGLAFGPQPYYREQLGYGSPPLAVRTGLMSLASTPILVALAGKANVLTFLTGMSHERLNIIHRWVAWMTFVLALIHTMGFIYAAESDPGWGGYERERHEFFAGGWTNNNQLSGVPPLVILFAICLVSVPGIRDRFHEAFWLSHVVLGITYIGLMYWHATAQDSWIYLWATIAVWLASWCARMFWKTRQLNLRTWFSGYQATLRVLPGNITRIEIMTDAAFKWTAGQHAFLRLPQLRPLQSHPFTITSHCSSECPAENVAVLLVRAHSGFTRQLLDYASKETIEKAGTCTVWLDGPYGGHVGTIYNHYDTLILIAGGTGISATIPWLVNSISRAKASKIQLQKVVLVWTIRDTDAMTWVDSGLEWVTSSRRSLKNLDVNLRLHITNVEMVACSKTSLLHKAGVTAHSVDECESRKHGINISPADIDSIWDSQANGRPDFLDTLQGLLIPGKQNLVLGCGPEGFQADLANSVASLQRMVLTSQFAEVAMHLEAYGW